jgi:hypothetical protein
VEELNRLREKLNDVLLWVKIAGILLFILILIVLDMKSDIRVNRITSSNNKTAIRVHAEHHKVKEVSNNEYECDRDATGR